MRWGHALVFLVAVSFCSGQELLDGQQADKVNRFLLRHAGGAEKSKQLDCFVSPVQPFLDFSFHFEAGYTIECPVRIFGGRQTTLRSFTRIKPESEPYVVLEQSYSVPALPHQLEGRIDIRKVKTSLETSGGFFLREGYYDVDFVLVDDGNRILLHHWHLSVSRKRAESDVKLAPLQRSVSPFSTAWEPVNRPDRARQHQLTLLVDAAPMNPYSRKLRAWDRAFLLGTVASVMDALPSESMHLVAFNLDQQATVFRDDHFCPGRMRDLSGALENLELGTISYQKLIRTNGSIDLLRTLMRDEELNDHASDAVIFIGPWTTLDTRVPRDEGSRSKGRPEFYDLVYYPLFLRGGEFPDAIAHFTRARNGSVHRIHSPGELGKALEKIASKLSARRNDTAAR